MRSAGRVTWMSRALMVLGFLSLLVPGIASASGKGGGARQVKSRTTARAKDSKKKMALQRSKMGREKKGGNSTKAAGSLPRPGAGKSTTRAASSQSERGMLASAIAGPTTRTAAARPGARARTTKASAQARSKTRRPVTRKTRTAKKTRRPTAKKRRAARTQRNRSRRSSQAGAAAAELAAAEQAQAADADADLGPEDMNPEQMDQGPSRTRKILTRVGIGVAIVGGAAIGLAAGWAVFPLIGGLTAVGGIPGTAIVGMVMGAGLSGGTASYFLKDKPERMAQQGGLGETGAEKLRRWATRRQLENAGLNGPGVGAGVGLNGPGLNLPGQVGNLRDGVGPN